MGLTTQNTLLHMPEKKLLQKGTTKSVITDVFHLNTCDHCAPVESPY